MDRVAYSTVSVKSQTVLPREIRDHLSVKAGDRLRYRIGKTGVVIEKVAQGAQDDPFVTFTEWASPDDEEAFADL